MAQTANINPMNKTKFNGEFIDSYPSSAPVRNAGSSVSLPVKSKFDIRTTNKKAQSAKQMKAKIKPSMR